jgi:hypothetical protein
MKNIHEEPINHRNNLSNSLNNKANKQEFEFLNRANWQQQGYSEEEVLELLNKSCDYIYDSSKIGTDKKLMPNLLRGWFEQFKKK